MIQKQKITGERSSLENYYNFDFVEGSDAKIVEIDNRKYYNILIRRSAENPDYIENLLIFIEDINNVEEVSAFIIKYNLSDESSLNSFSEIDTDITPLFARTIMHCYNVCTTLCYNIIDDIPKYAEPHTPGSGCTIPSFLATTCSPECKEITTGILGDGSYNTPFENPFANGGGSTEGSNQTTTVTTPENQNGTTQNSNQLILSPVLEDEIETTPKNKPCEKLNAMANKTIANITPIKTVLTNFLDLKTNVLNNRERMYVMSPTPNNDGSINHSLYKENYEQSELNQDNVNADFGDVIIDIMVHTHWSTTRQLSVFSLEDIYQIYLKIVSGQINTENKDYFTAMVITAHGTQYALKFSNINSFVTWSENYFQGWDFPNEALRVQYQIQKETSFYNDNKIVPGNTDLIKTRNELGLASFFQSENVGLELYRADDTFTQYTKLSTTLFGGLKETPCPN